MSTSIEISEKTAKKLLARWLRERDTRISGHVSWTRVTFAERHYWAGVVAIWGSIAHMGVARFGFHVYDSGEVVLVGRMDYSEAEE